jgi:hypothetical protein
MNEVAEDHGPPVAVRNATRIGMLVGACTALLWIKSILSFANRPIETDELGLYSLFAFAYCAFCLVMFAVLVAGGATIGWFLGIVVVRIVDRRASRHRRAE